MVITSSRLAGGTNIFPRSSKSSSWRHRCLYLRFCCFIVMW